MHDRLPAGTMPNNKEHDNSTVYQEVPNSCIPQALSSMIVFCKAPLFVETRYRLAMSLKVKIHRHIRILDQVKAAIRKLLFGLDDFPETMCQVGLDLLGATIAVAVGIRVSTNFLAVLLAGIDALGMLALCTA